MNKINNYSFISNSFCDEDNSEDNFSQKLIFNNYITQGSIPFLNTIDFNECNSLHIMDKEEKIGKNIISKENNRSNKKDQNSLKNKKKHSGKSPDNDFKKKLRYCMKNIYKYLQKEIKLFAKHKKIRIRRLHIPPIKKYLTKGNIEKCILLEKSIKTLFIDMIPKRVKNEIKNEREKYCHNKIILNKILKIEENDEKIKEKTFNIRFNAEFKIYFKAFLNNDKFIKINGILFYLTEEFKTIKDYYKEGKLKYTEKEKKACEEYINKIMNKNIQFRKTE